MTNTVAVFDASNVLVGTFSTIQDAVDNSVAGYSIHISAGTYAESVNIDVAINIFGAGAGQTIVTPPSGSGFIINSDLGTSATLAIDGITFSDSANGSGIQFTNSGVLGTLQITNSDFTGNFRNGLAVGGNSTPVDLDNVIITDSTFSANGGDPASQTSSGDGDLLFFQYYGDATITNVAIVGAVTGTGPAENALQFRGDAGAMGTVTLTDVAISGPYEKQPIGVFNYTNIDGMSGSNVTVTSDSTGFNIAANFDGVNGDIDISALGISTVGAPDPLQMVGGSASQLLASGAENSILVGLGGNDTISGGGGTDNAVYLGAASDFTVTATTNGSGWATSFASAADNNAGDGDEGADALSNIETLTFLTGGSVFSVSDPVQLYDGSGNIVGTFATIQDAVNAADDGYTVLVDSGVYREQVVVNGIDNLTIRGVNGPVTIEAPDTLAQTSTSSSGRAVFGVVTVEDASNVVIEDISIDGRGVTSGLSGSSPNNVGVFYRNASGGLENVDVAGIHDPYPGGTAAGGEPIVSGIQRGVGVQADNDAGPVLSFFMHGGTISDFQKNATVFGYADLDISGVTIVGGGAQTIIAQNGFQAFNSTGSINGNTVLGIGYAGPSFVYSGAILLFDNTDLDVTNNVIVGSNNDDLNAKVVGIFVFDNAGPFSGGSITGNTISFVDTGIGVYGDNQPNQIIVNSNTISNIDASDPFAAGVDFEPNSALATAYTVEGSSQSDILWGAAAGDLIEGLAGADTIIGNGGNDTLRGGDDNDQIFAGFGNDRVEADAGADMVSAGPGRDTLLGGSGNDTLGASNGSDLLRGDVGDDLLLGSNGNDRLFGDAGGDNLKGGNGRDTLEGGAGFDRLDGGNQSDTASYANAASGVWVRLWASDGLAGEALGDTLTAIESITGSSHADTLEGDDGANRLNGGDGADSLSGLNGNDIFVGGRGADLMSGGAGNDQFWIFAGDGADTISDFIAGAASDDSVRIFGRGAAVDTFAELMALATQQGSDVVFNFGGGDTLTLQGVTLSSLHANDFVFG